MFQSRPPSLVGFYFAEMCPNNYVPVVDSVLFGMKQRRRKCLELINTETTLVV